MTTHLLLAFVCGAYWSLIFDLDSFSELVRLIHSLIQRFCFILSFSTFISEFQLLK